VKRVLLAGLTGTKYAIAAILTANHRPTANDAGMREQNN